MKGRRRLCESRWDGIYPAFNGLGLFLVLRKYCGFLCGRLFVYYTPSRRRCHILQFLVHYVTLCSLLKIGCCAGFFYWLVVWSVIFARSFFRRLLDYHAIYVWYFGFVLVDFLCFLDASMMNTCFYLCLRRQERGEDGLLGWETKSMRMTGSAISFIHYSGTGVFCGFFVFAFFCCAVGFEAVYLSMHGYEMEESKMGLGRSERGVETVGNEERLLLTRLMIPLRIKQCKHRKLTLYIYVSCLI